jgi:hypothetical protein
MRLPASVRERALDVRSLRPPVRLVVALAYAQLLSGIVLLAAKSAPAPLVRIAGDLTIFAPNFAFALASFAGGTALLLAGTFLASAPWRFAGAAAFSAFAFAFGGFVAGSAARTVALVAAVVVWTAACATLRWGRPSFSAALGGALLTAGALFAAFRASALGAQGFAIGTLSALLAVTFALVPVLVLTGAELGEWSRLAGTGFASLTGAARPARMRAAVAPLAIAALGTWALLDGRRHAVGLSLLGESVLFAAVAGLAYAAIARGSRRAALARHVPYRTLVALALAYVSVSSFAPLVLARLTATASSAYYGYSVLFWLVAGVAAAAVLVRSPSISAALTLVFSATLVLGQSRFLTALVAPHGPTLPALRPNGISVTVATASLGYLAYLAWTKRVAQRDAAVPLLLALNVALGVATLLYELYDRVIAAGSARALAQVAIVFVALSCEIWTSGESITNRDSRSLPREARVLLFLGYVLSVSAAILMLSSLRTAAGVPLEVFDSEEWPQTGILWLGIPLILTLAAASLPAALRETASPALPARAGERARAGGA